MSHPRPTPRPSPDAGPPGRGHRPHVPRLPSSLDPSHHPARSITRPGVTRPRVTTATPVTVSPTGPIHHPLTWVRPPQMFHSIHLPDIPTRSDTVQAGPIHAFSPHFSHTENGLKTGSSPDPRKRGKISPENPLQKFVTPHRYFLASICLTSTPYRTPVLPTAQICDTPQLRNTPIFPSTASRKNL